MNTLGVGLHFRLNRNFTMGLLKGWVHTALNISSGTALDTHTRLSDSRSPLNT